MAMVPEDTAPENEVLAFYRFLGEQIHRGANEITVEENIEAFRASQRDAARLRQRPAPSMEQARRGESKPLDAEAVIERAASRRSEEGIAD